MSFLADILERKRLEVAERRAKEPDAALESRAQAARRAAPRSSLFAALSAPGGDTRVIAEVKRASPSVGNIHTGLDAPALAKRYAQGGASALSVLTDGPGFGGSLEDLRQVRAVVEQPVLRKDFVVDRYQLLEAAAAGADVVLLIVAALDDAVLRRLHQEATELGLEVLVEVHDEAETHRALAAGARLVGINNRNLATFEVSLTVTERLMPLLPASVKAVAESGVRTPADVARLRQAGAVNFLIGEALVRAPDAGELLRAMREAR